MNEYDSKRIFDMAKKIDYVKTENILDANCYVLNTCHIRKKQQKKFTVMSVELKKSLGIKKTNSNCNWMCCTSRV